ncbi:5-formyltetrahydrofolate cyclo-ligase [Aquiflexum sp. TKW24L]|uniref:5-formyltetrahydrofolate cyclo-ligase n=1 Tax=Aquiflexum sp. TKW24L TaxID=2942212 RepID=UPI0020BD850B|nr:5-formyltetrahydrofolate cyclo-ligase [Aquiflexum sp. TKW24L]MCL6258588.1 5-formyltetrahydrofolate cyclo-ligase [Aquiflexum sp. TKW24L]
MDKSAIRKEYLALRKALPNEKREAYSNIICNRILEYLHANPSIRHIHIFLSISRLNEIDTFPLVKKLQDLGYQLYTSYVNPESKVLDTLDITHTTEFESDSFGIPIPKDFVVVTSDQIQLVLVPLLAFDEKGNRIGYGKAFYDIFLAKLHHEVIKVGLSYFSPEKEIPAEPHDIRLDICITPEEIYHSSHF